MNQVQIDPQLQQKLNTPPVNPKGLSQEDQAFLNQFTALADSGKVNLMQPSSLINHAIYDQLTPDKQGKVDFDAVNLATTLRNIYWLWKANPAPTYQIENMVHSVRLTKERLEEISGDVYVI